VEIISSLTKKIKYLRKFGARDGFSSVGLNLVWLPVLMILLRLCVGCAPEKTTSIYVTPKNFHIQLPFEIGREGIFIDTYWGKEKIKHRLLWDNHSPTWAGDKTIRNNISVFKSTDLTYRTTTADGSSIEGDVYICDSIAIGPVTFGNVALYEIKNKRIDGVLGDNIISKGVWKFDFDKSEITFASGIDSITDIQYATKLPATFTENAVLIKVAFRNDVEKNLELDFGFNGAILLPSDTFKKVAKGNMKFYKDTRGFSTPANSNITEHSHAFDSVFISDSSFVTFLTTNKLNKESLIGLAFFRNFHTVVLDYINKAIYIKRKR
jgi:hypothetical protein